MLAPYRNGQAEIGVFASGVRAACRWPGVRFDARRADRARGRGHHIEYRRGWDATRERVHEQMHEPYRTLALGHLRHETGHYYWDRLIAGSTWLDPFRALFGDETVDYTAALHNHYQQGPAGNWREHYVSAYASVHPWEDWAETWAHYLHLVDTLATASSFRLAIDSVELPFERFQADSLAQPEAANAVEFLELLNAWGRVTLVLNELSRSMGLPDFYPFVVSRDAVANTLRAHY